MRFGRFALGEQHVALQLVEGAFENANLFRGRLLGLSLRCFEGLRILALEPHLGFGQIDRFVLILLESLQAVFEQRQLSLPVLNVTLAEVGTSEGTKAFDLLGMIVGRGEVLGLRVGDQLIPQLVLCVGLEQPQSSVMGAATTGELVVFRVPREFDRVP